MANSDLNQFIGEMVQAKRLDKNWSQGELGRKIGYSQQSISDLETGRSRISAIALFSIADAFESDLNDFRPATEEDNPFNYLEE